MLGNINSELLASLRPACTCTSRSLMPPASFIRLRTCCWSGVTYLVKHVVAQVLELLRRHHHDLPILQVSPSTLYTKPKLQEVSVWQRLPNFLTYGVAWL